MNGVYGYFIVEVSRTYFNTNDIFTIQCQKKPAPGLGSSKGILCCGWSLILQRLAYIIFLERKNSRTTSDTARFFSSTS